MKETTAIIERIKRVNAGYQRLELSVDDSLLKLKPGQSIMARRSDRWDPYLLEQWWPVNLLRGKLVIERPDSEQYEPGQVVPLLGVIGQPFRFRGSASLRNVLLVAYNTPPTPLLMTIPWLLGNKISVTMALLGSAAAYDTQHLPPEVEIELGGDEFEWENQVMTLGWADQVFITVGPDDEFQRFNQVIERFRELRHDIPRNYLFGVFQGLLPCGSGACHSCMVRTTQGTALVCTEGPAFDLTQVILS
ncbi:MAG TPA: hypothetical protein VHL11_11620 [Phototrophicaceae bacterium]|jgi:hypothetical protein|nr:hypothetical protein [Phototrophicaceae bacterium]